MKFPLSRPALLLWIVSLAFLGVGTRNFEPGLSVDGPLYCAIARQIVRSHEWFSLYGGVPDFVPFAEHPHGWFWLMALWFKIFPIEDWSARIPGHLFYVGFLYILFRFVRERSSERVAVGSVLLLWVWDRFSSYYSSVYLDPAALFFGALFLFSLDRALRTLSYVQALVAGASVAFCVLIKGVIIAGFLPSAIGLCLWKMRDQLSKRLTVIAMVLAAAFCILFAYFMAIRMSSVPNFFEIYWTRQMTQRFFPMVKWSELWSLQFWWILFRDTHLLLPLVLLIGLRKPREIADEFLIPLLCFVTFIFLYAPISRVRSQYWVTLFPWIGWLISGGVSKIWQWNEQKAVPISAGVALMGVAIVQYLPFRTHLNPPGEAASIRSYVEQQKVNHLYVDPLPERRDFTQIAGFAWYGDINIDYADASQKVPVPDTGALYLLLDERPEKRTALMENHWCLLQNFAVTSLWGYGAHLCHPVKAAGELAFDENGTPRPLASR